MHSMRFDAIGRKEGTVEQKKTWSDPQLTVYGDVEALTLANNKNFGTGDAFTFQNNPTRLSG